MIGSNLYQVFNCQTLTHTQNKYTKKQKTMINMVVIFLVFGYLFFDMCLLHLADVFLFVLLGAIVERFCVDEYKVLVEAFVVDATSTVVFAFESSQTR